MATIDNDVEAFIGPRSGSAATVVSTTGGNLDLIATSSQTAKAPVSGGGGGGFEASFIEARTSIASTVQAFVGDGTTIAAAGSVQLRAEVLNAVADSGVTVGSGGVITVRGTTADARSTVATKAYLGDGVTVGTMAAPINGDVTITAIGQGEADAVGNAYGGGGVSIALPEANAVVDPDVDAHVGTSTAATRTTVVVATGTITVLAQLTRVAPVANDQIRSISLDRNTLTFEYPGIGEGAQVQYSGPTGNGLNVGRIYTVLDTEVSLTPHQIRLGSLFDASSSIDPVRETITFGSPHGFNAGDCVYYDPRAGTSAVVRGAQANEGTCTATVTGAQRYFVRVIDETTIQLTRTRAAALATDDATITVTPGAPVTAGDPTPLTLSSTAGIGVGTALIYRAPVAVTFFGAFVNVTLVDGQDTGGNTIKVPGTGHDQSLENIYVGSTDWGKLNPGDAVRYALVGTGFPIGLSDTTTYFVIKNADGYTIRLATSYCNAVGAAGDATNCAGATVTAVDLTVPANGDNAEHHIARSLGGLVEGQTYYVATITGSVVTLAASPGGPGLVLTTDRRPGPHEVGIVEIDLERPTFPGGASTSQALFVDITTDCASNCGRLLAPGGLPLGSVVAAAGNGVSGASAQGGTAGVGDFAFINATLSGSPSVSLTIGALQLIAGGDVMLTADSVFEVSARTDATGIGGVTWGRTFSSADLGDSPTTVTMAASSSISAGRDVVVTAKTNHTLSASSRAVGGGLIAVKIARTHVAVDNDVEISVGTAGVVTAGRALRMLISSGTTASTYAETYTVAGGAGGKADSDHDGRGVRIGSLSDQAMRSITIGARAQLTARTVELDAAVTVLNLTAKATATSYSPVLCCHASAFAFPYIDVYSKTLVQVLDDAAGTTTITGIEGVDLKARHIGTLNVTRDGYSLAVAFPSFPQHTRWQGTDSLTNEVNTDRAALVIAGARQAGTPPGGLAPSPAGMAVALYVQAHTNPFTPVITGDSGLFTTDESSHPRSANIFWDADVIILGGSGGQGYLVVGANGNVLAASAVQVRNAAGTLVTPTEGQPVPLNGGSIIVGAIAASGAADILMQADNDIRNQDYTIPPNTIGNPNNPWPTFEFRRTLSDVTIINLSPRDLVIEGIRVIDDGTNRNPLVRLIPRGGAATGFRDAVTLEFDLRLGVVAPSYVDIEQRAATVQRLVIAGLIDNPIGLTRLVNLNGPIVANAGSRIVTNLLDAYAPSTTNGSIGSASGRLTVDLVQYRAFPSLIDPVGGFFDPRIVVEAGVDAYLSLRGVDRTNSFTGSMATTGNSLTRSSGSWISDGFVFGDVIVVFGLSGGQRTYEVTSVSATVLGLRTVFGGGAAPGTGTATLSVVRTVPMAITLDQIQAGRDVNIELRTTIRQPGGAAGGLVDVQVINEAASTANSWANPKPHISHFRGPISADPLVYDPRRTGFSGSPSGTGTTTTGAEVSIDGNYTIHLRNPVAARVTEPFNGAVRFVPTPVPGGPRFTIFTTDRHPAHRWRHRRRPRPLDQGHRGSHESEPAWRRTAARCRAISVRGWIEMRDVTPGLLERQRRRAGRPRRAHRRHACRSRPLAHRRRPARRSVDRQHPRRGRLRAEGRHRPAGRRGRQHRPGGRDQRRHGPGLPRDQPARQRQRRDRGRAHQLPRRRRRVPHRGRRRHAGVVRGHRRGRRSDRLTATSCSPPGSAASTTPRPTTRTTCSATAST